MVINMNEYMGQNTILVAGLMAILLSGLLSWPAPLWFITSVPARALLLSLIGIISNQASLTGSKVLFITASSFAAIKVMDHFFPPEKSVQALFHHTLQNKTWTIVRKQEDKK